MRANEPITFTTTVPTDSNFPNVEVRVMSQTNVDTSGIPVDMNSISSLIKLRKVIPFSNADEIDAYPDKEWFQRLDCENNRISLNISIFNDENPVTYTNVVEVFSNEEVIGYRYGKDADVKVFFVQKVKELSEKDLFSNLTIK